MLVHILEQALLNSILISGLVVIMMIMIECINIDSKGGFFAGLTKSKVGGVLVGSILGIIPGCLGGFATVSLYTHRLLSFGALIAMMIASAGDEAFVMLATIPEDALWIFALLFVISIVAGVLTDIFVKDRVKIDCTDKYEVHEDDKKTSIRGPRSFGWRRILMFSGIIIFLVALVTGLLGHEDEEMVAQTPAGLNLLSEEWMNIFFAALSVVVLVVLVIGSDHFVEHHLWKHVIAGHLPTIFAWTFGVLVALGLLLNFVDIKDWISDNTVLMILLATAVGIIPESGPHLIFVTLFAAGIVPLPVLLASCISQDGHASLPLIAESKVSYFKAKLINCAVALAVGFACLAFTPLPS